MELNHIYEPHLSQCSVFFNQFLLRIIENVLYFLHIPPLSSGKNLLCFAEKTICSGFENISDFNTAHFCFQPLECARRVPGKNHIAVGLH